MSSCPASICEGLFAYGGSNNGFAQLGSKMQTSSWLVDEKTDDSPVLWTQAYQPDEDSSEDTDASTRRSGSVGVVETPSAYADLEKDEQLELEGVFTVSMLRTWVMYIPHAPVVRMLMLQCTLLLESCEERIEATVGDFKTRAELFERCGYDMVNISEVMKAAFPKRKPPWADMDKQPETRKLMTAPPASTSLLKAGDGKSQEGGGGSTTGKQGFTTGLFSQAGSGHEGQKKVPADDEWVNGILSAPYYPGDLMLDLDEYTETPSETFELLWTGDEGAFDFVYCITIDVIWHDLEIATYVFYDSDPDSSDATEPDESDSEWYLNEDDVETDESEEEAEEGEEGEEMEEDDEEDEMDAMNGLRRLDDEALAAVLHGIRGGPATTGRNESMRGEGAAPAAAQGGPDSMSVDAPISAIEEGGLAEGTASITSAFASERSSSHQVQQSHATAQHMPTPPPAPKAVSGSGQKRAREEEQDTTNSGGYGGLKGLKLTGQEGAIGARMMVTSGKFSGLDDTDSEEEKEERPVDPRQAAKHVRHKMEVGSPLRGMALTI